MLPELAASPTSQLQRTFITSVTWLMSILWRIVLGRVTQLTFLMMNYIKEQPQTRTIRVCIMVLDQWTPDFSFTQRLQTLKIQTCWVVGNHLENFEGGKSRYKVTKGMIYFYSKRCLPLQSVQTEIQSVSFNLILLLHVLNLTKVIFLGQGKSFFVFLLL